MSNLMTRPRNMDRKPLPEVSSNPSTSESARYTYDMLISLKKIPPLRKEVQLMRLIDAAAKEARALSKAS